jgi:hypothetical protein
MGIIAAIVVAASRSAERRHSSHRAIEESSEVIPKETAP